MVRDGRDVASSLVSMRWGPDTLAGGIDRWKRQVRRAAAGARGVPEGRVLRLQLEDLVEDDRERSYQRLLEFLEVEDEDAMRSHFEENMNPRVAHMGRWRELPEDDRKEVTRLYRRALEQLAGEGVEIAGELAARAELELRDRSAPSRPTPPEPAEEPGRVRGLVHRLRSRAST